MGENTVEVHKRGPVERIGMMCDRLEQVAADPTCTPALPGAILLAAWGIRDALKDLARYEQALRDIAAQGKMPGPDDGRTASEVASDVIGLAIDTLAGSEGEDG